MLEAALRDGKRLLLPRVEAEGLLTFRRITHPDQLVKGSYGIPEPPPEAAIADPGIIDLLLTPLEGLDRTGMRLGKGGGYYDRLLSRYAPVTLGVVLSHQWAEAIPHDPWDRPLTGAVDRDGIVWFYINERTESSYGGSKEDSQDRPEGGEEAVSERRHL